MEKISIGLSDIFEYVSSRRPIKEGEAVFSAGHITLCGLKADSQNCEIVGFCLQTSDLNGPPHKIEISITDDVKQWKATCTCTAGLGSKCKHIVAVLIHINRTGEVEKLSCTDLDQMWGKVGLKHARSEGLVDNSAAKKIKDFCHPVTKKVCICPEGDLEEMDRSNFQILKNCDSSTALAKVLEGRKMEQQKITECYNFNKILNYLQKENKVLKTIALSVEDKEKTKFYIDFIDDPNIKNVYLETRGQNNSFWLQIRKYRFSGSNCYSWFTYSKNKNPDWNKKIQSHLSPTFKGNAATRYGKKTEFSAKKRYEEISNQRVEECGLIINPVVPWLAFSPDGISDEGFLIEIKCPVAGE